MHVNPLAFRMRECDRHECWALGRTPKDALRLSLRTSLHALTALDDGGKVLAMFGVCPTGILTGKGVPWFLGTEGVFDYGRDLMLRGPRIIRWWGEDFDLMENIVSRENVKAIALLQKWGAVIGGEVQTHRGIEFVNFRFETAIQARRHAA
jgi:hypothetical protein